MAAAAGDETALLRLREFEWHFRFTVLAGPAYQLWLRVLVNGERKPELMREAIRLGEEAQANTRLSGDVARRGGVIANLLP